MSTNLTSSSLVSKVIARALRFIVLSDIHLGHHRTTTSEIIQNLKKAIPDNAETAELDIIFLAGDVFDRLLSLSGDDIWEIKIWIAHLLRLCKKHDIMLRVLEGTPSHDWKQSQLFPSINSIAKIGADLKYVKDLSIEHIERYGITVLYVPDEWGTTTDHTLSQVHELLKAQGLTSVNYAIMHGHFEFQIPEHLNLPHHKAEEYLKIVTDEIFIGHDHEWAQYKRITSQGSFDCLGHGQKGPKGHAHYVKHANGDKTITFVETEGAKQYVTVRCLGMDLDETLKEVERCVKDLRHGAYVRIEGDSKNAIFTNMMLLVRHWPTFNFTKLVKSSDPKAVEIIDNTDVYVPIQITPDNLSGLMMERMAAANLKPAVLTAAKKILAGVL